MRLFSATWLSVCVYFSVTALSVVYSESFKHRTEKHFSLFSVVTFQNAECTSDSTLTGGATQGTCYTATECTDKGGTKSGNCASGFGVCCVFLNNAGATASTIKENRTRIRNKEFPSTSTATTATTYVYTINKMKSDICQLRLDFTTFVIAGPINTDESVPTGEPGTNCQDTLRITTTEATTWTNSQTGTLCGALTGEHLYVDLTRTSTDVATITLVTAVSGTLTPAIAQRVWDIKTSQIECHATYKAPHGCQRYFTSDYGKIISYNFRRIATPVDNGQNTGLELYLQRVNTCIRRSKGMCCVEYQLCSAYNDILLNDFLTTSDTGGITGGDIGYKNEAFSIDLILLPYAITTAGETDLGLVDSQCSGDYIEIPSSWAASCGLGTGAGRNHIYTRYCGSLLGHHEPAIHEMAADNRGVSSPVCDCSEPFMVRHSSDDVADFGGILGHAVDNTISSATGFGRGFCLDFKQIPCWQ